MNRLVDEESETRITHVDKTSLSLKQEVVAQDFLKKHVDNDNLYIFPNIYKQKGKEMFILLNLQDKESFQNFITNNYKIVLRNQHNIIISTTSTYTTPTHYKVKIDHR
jgi:hypothetical protein